MRKITRNALRRTLTLESLEGRLLLALSESGAEYLITEQDVIREHQKVDVVMASIPGGLRDKVSYDFWFSLMELEGLAQSALVPPRPGSDLPSIPVTPLSQTKFLHAYGAQVTDDGKVFLQLMMNEMSSATLGKLQEVGAEVRATIPEYRQVNCWISIFNVRALGDIAEVDHIELGQGATTRVTSQGDSVINADDVRSNFAAAGVDGSGIKVGVISDGVSHRTSVGSELPTISVNPSLPGTGDEGTAMLEIVHDIAPSADLLFSGGSASTTDFIDSVNWLVGQNVDVIVDDLGFYDEPFFIDGTVATTVASAVAGGVTYVSAAGNDAQAHYEGQFSPTFLNYHNFGTDHAFAVDVANLATIVVYLQWSDGWTTSGNDYNLEIWRQVNGNGVLQTASNIVQNGNDTPREKVTWTNTTGAAQTVTISVQGINGAAARRLELFVRGNSYSVPDADKTPVGSIFGHPAVDGVIAVGAAGYATPSVIQSYSSQGPSKIYTNTATQTYVDRASLDGISIDDVTTKIGQLGYFADPFPGTSAAAPHVAGLAALLLDAKDEHIGPSDIVTALTSSAVDLGAGGYDDISGYGRFDATAAMTAHKIWMNAFTGEDVNDDGLVTPLDANLVIIDLNAYGARTLPDANTPEAPNFIDVNGDYLLSPLDALLVIIYLNSHRGTEEETGELVGMRVEATSESGEPIDEIEVGQAFYLSVYVQDLRSSAQGVFAAFIDMDVDPDLAVKDDSASLSDLGALFGTDPTGGDEQLLYQGRFIAVGDGQLVVSLEQSVGLGMETFLYDNATPVSDDDITFGTATLTINPA